MKEVTFGMWADLNRVKCEAPIEVVMELPVRTKTRHSLIAVMTLGFSRRTADFYRNITLLSNFSDSGYFKQHSACIPKPVNITVTC